MKISVTIKKIILSSINLVGKLTTLKEIIYFNWRLIIVVAFAMHWHESAMGVHVSPILNPSLTSFPIPSLWVVPSHRIWVPVSSIALGLVIYFTYGIIHISMLFSQIIPPSSSPTESKNLFFVSVSHLLSWV